MRQPGDGRAIRSLNRGIPPSLEVVLEPCIIMRLRDNLAPAIPGDDVVRIQSFPRGQENPGDSALASGMVPVALEPLWSC